jgi:hypothetical protein
MIVALDSESSAAQNNKKVLELAEKRICNS